MSHPYAAHLQLLGIDIWRLRGADDDDAPDRAHVAMAESAQAPIAEPPVPAPRPSLRALLDESADKKAAPTIAAVISEPKSEPEPIYEPVSPVAEVPVSAPAPSLSDSTTLPPQAMVSTKTTRSYCGRLPESPGRYLDTTLAEQTLKVIQGGQGSGLLLVLDGPTLTPGSSPAQLLARMFSAIDLPLETIATAVNDAPEPGAPGSGHRLDHILLRGKPRAVMYLYSLQAQLPHQALDHLRGRVVQVANTRVPALVSHHPSYVAENSDAKRPLWEDLKRLRTLLSV